MNPCMKALTFPQWVPASDSCLAPSSWNNFSSSSLNWVLTFSLWHLLRDFSLSCSSLKVLHYVPSAHSIHSLSDQACTQLLPAPPPAASCFEEARQTLSGDSVVHLLIISPIVYFAPAAWKLFLVEQWCFVAIFHQIAALVSWFTPDTEQPAIPVSHLAHGRKLLLASCLLLQLCKQSSHWFLLLLLGPYLYNCSIPLLTPVVTW